MKKQINLYIAIFVVVIFAWQFYTIKSLKAENTKLETAYRDSLRIKIAEKQYAIDTLINNSLKRIDTIVIEKIKYSPYEKIIYIDRSIDDNLNILAE